MAGVALKRCFSSVREEYFCQYILLSVCVINRSNKNNENKARYQNKNRLQPNEMRNDSKVNYWQIVGEEGSFFQRMLSSCLVLFCLLSFDRIHRVQCSDQTSEYEYMQQERETYDMMVLVEYTYIRKKKNRIKQTKIQREYGSHFVLISRRRRRKKYNNSKTKLKRFTIICVINRNRISSRRVQVCFILLLPFYCSTVFVRYLYSLRVESSNFQ